MAFTYIAKNIAQAIVYSIQAETEFANKSSKINGTLDMINYLDGNLNIGLSSDVESIRNALLSLRAAVSNAKTAINGAKAAILASDEAAAAEISYYMNNELNYLYKTDSNFIYYSNTNEGLTSDDKEYIRENIRHILYSNDAYGGAQIQPYLDYIYYEDNTYSDIIKKYYPKMTDEEINDYLLAMNNVGCGYVATANYVFESYKDDPEQFEKDFGFPMFNKDDNGQLHANVNYLFADIYCYANKKNITEVDDIKNLWGISDTLSNDPTRAYRGSSNRNRGTVVEKRITILESDRYEKSGVKTDVLEDWYDTKSNFKNYDKEIKENLKKGNLINFDATDYTLYPADKNGNKKEYAEPRVMVDAPHDMTITGVNKDGDFIVSTWGEKYVLDSDSVDPNFGINVISFEKGDDDDK